MKKARWDEHAGMRALRGGGVEFAFRLEAELAAGGVDVVAFFAADRDGDVPVAEDGEEFVLAENARAFPGEAFDGVVGDEVDVGVEVGGDFGEGFGLFERVVDVLDQDELEGEHAAVALGEEFDGGEKFFERPAFVDRHDLLADFVGGAVEADGEAELDVFLGEAFDGGNYAGGGDGDAAGAEMERPFGVYDFEGGEEVVVIGQRFAHAHDDDVVEGGNFGAGARGAGVFEEADLEELGNDFAGGEIAFPSIESGGAEFAAERATDLGGDADGFAGLLDADAFLGDADNDGFDEGAVAELEEEFVGDVAGFLGEEVAGGLDVVVVVEPGAEGFGEVGHLVPGGDAFFVKPIHDLFRAERFFAGFGEALGETVEGFAVDRLLFGNELHG